MPLKLSIIQPSHYRSKSDLSPHKVKKRSVVGLTLPYLAALTPPGWNVRLVDEEMEDIDFKAPVDLVAITTRTINSLRAYEVADRFRKQGTPVIMGGPHTCFHADEAAEHCDAVGIGEGERIWPSMLDDFIKGRLKTFYRAPASQSLERLPLPRWDLLDFSRYSFVKTFSVEASRGCPNACEFCSERFYLGQRYRFRPVEDVIADVKRTKSRYILFTDSNFGGRPSHTRELMKALAPLKVRWSALWPVDLCLDNGFMDLARRSGLLHVNIGMESIDEETLRGLGKKGNKVDRYDEALGNLRKRGISYSLNFIFGWDSEKEDVFSSTLAFLEKEKVPAAYFNILTPHKGTPLYERMKADGRIIDVDGIGRWPGIRCHISPARYTPADLENRVAAMYREFYTFKSMLARLPLPVTQPAIASWIINLSQRRVARTPDGVENFDEY
jgi:radical SAM superfamily enzyme YgiQ (UPF0313 family)